MCIPVYELQQKGIASGFFHLMDATFLTIDTLEDKDSNETAKNLLAHNNNNNTIAWHS